MQIFISLKIVIFVLKKIKLFYILNLIYDLSKKYTKWSS